MDAALTYKDWCAAAENLDIATGDRRAQFENEIILKETK